MLKLLFTAAKLRIRQFPKTSHKGNDDKRTISPEELEHSHGHEIDRNMILYLQKL